MDTVRLRLLQKVDHVRQVGRVYLPGVGGCEDAVRADVIALEDAHGIKAPHLGLGQHPGDIRAIVESRVERHVLDVAASHVADFEIVQAQRVVGPKGSRRRRTGRGGRRCAPRPPAPCPGSLRSE